MTTKNKKRIFKDVSNFVLETIKDCKLKTIIVFTVSIIALLTGIIVAIRTHNNYTISNDFGVVDITSNSVSVSTFFTRLLSMCLVFLVLFGSAYNRYTFIIGIVFLAYRAYLLGLNVCLMIVFYGFSGVVVSVIVAFPCQLITLAILGIFFILMSKTFVDYRAFGGCRTPRQKTKLVVITLILLLSICIIESILLTLFSAKIILVI